jgi:alpha-tubulin suppressor-like RCC1 family protein
MTDVKYTLSHRSLSEKQPLLGIPLAGKGNTLIIKLRNLSTNTIAYYGGGESLSGELGPSATRKNYNLMSSHIPLLFNPYVADSDTIEGGKNHFHLVYSPGTTDEVYSWGSNQYYQLGTGGKDSSGNNLVSKAEAPREISSGIVFSGSHRIRTINSGWDHTNIVTRSNRLITWGRNEYGQLGLTEDLGGISGVEPTEVSVTLSGNIFSTSAGEDFTVLLTDEGNVYAYGRNNKGQLTISATPAVDFCENPIRIDISNVVDIYCGKDFALALKSNSEVWGWGNNISGQITGISSDDLYEPTYSNQDDVVYASCGNKHSIFLKKKGTVKLHGDNTYFQSSEPSTNKEFTYCYAIQNNTVLSTLDGNIYIYGEGISGTSSGSFLLQDASSRSFSSTPLVPQTFINLDTKNVFISPTGGAYLNLVYDLVESLTENLEDLPYQDEDRIMTSQEYLENQKSIAFLCEVERRTNSTRGSCEECAAALPTQIVIPSFKDHKELMMFQRGMLIKRKACLIKNS